MRFDKIRSYAKINIALNIIGKTTNLHRIESIVAFVSLHDVIFIKKVQSQKHIIIFKGKFSKDIPKDNSILKLFEHPLTDIGLKKFLDDHFSVNKK